MLESNQEVQPIVKWTLQEEAGEEDIQNHVTETEYVQARSLRIESW